MDPEIKAMDELTKALAPLDEEARGRVLRWAGQRFGVKAGASERSQEAGGGSGDDRVEPKLDRGFSHLSELYDAASPSTDADRALVAALWFQKYENQDSVESQPVNDALKHLGHGIGNITRAFTALKKTSPSLIIQLEKQGKTKQARKKYKVTTAGERYVNQLIQHNNGVDE